MPLSCWLATSCFAGSRWAPYASLPARCSSLPACGCCLPAGRLLRERPHLLGRPTVYPGRALSPCYKPPAQATPRQARKWQLDAACGSSDRRLMPCLGAALKAGCRQLLVDLLQEPIETVLGATLGPSHEHVLSVRSA